jgi:hypothetical protein
LTLINRPVNVSGLNVIAVRRPRFDKDVAHRWLPCAPVPDRQYRLTAATRDAVVQTTAFGAPSPLTIASTNGRYRCN